MTPEVKERIEQIRHGNVPEGYKRTKAGIYPEDWTEYTLGDIYTERKEPGNENLPLLMVSIHSGVSDGEVDEEDLPKKVKRIEDKSQYKRAASGDLVFNMMRAWQGAIGTVRTAGMVSPAYIVAEPNDLVDPLFMDYYMKTKRMISTIHRQSYGVTDFRLRLYWDSFSSIECALPTLKEQRIIATVIATQDKIIDTKLKHLAQIMQRKKYIEQTVFGKTENNVVLSDVATITMGQSPSSRTYNTLKQGVPLIQGNADIVNRRPQPRMYTTEPTKLCEAEDILLSVRAPVGTVARSNIEACIGRGMCAIKSNSMQDYIFEYLMYYEDKWGRVSQGSTFESISGEDIANLQIPVCEKYESVSDLLILADREIEIMCKCIEQELMKKKALMQLLLTGIVRV